MNTWMIGMSAVGGLAFCAWWSREWARRKALNATAWGWAGAVAGPLGVAAVGLRRAEGALCPHCGAPMRFEERYCSTCRALEGTAVAMPLAAAAMAVAVADERDVLFGHGYFESQPSAA